MRHKMTFIVFLAGLFIAIPYLITRSMEGPSQSLELDNYSSGYQVYVDGTAMDLERYVIGVLPSQISMDYHIEAIKAQTVILRTDIIRRMGKNKSISQEELPYEYQGDEEMKTALGEKSYILKDQIRKKARKETLGQVLLYKNSYIEPYFHGVSVGTTLDGQSWFGKSVPYLKEKDSLDDLESKEYMSAQVFTYKQVADTIKKEKNVVRKESDIRRKITTSKTTKNGYVKEVKVADLTVQGQTWASWFHLASNNFYMEDYDGKLRIICLGKGNGLGLSQFGANKMAENQKTYKNILKYYYTGVKIKNLKDV